MMQSRHTERKYAVIDDRNNEENDSDFDDIICSGNYPQNNYAIDKPNNIQINQTKNEFNREITCYNFSPLSISNNAKIVKSKPINRRIEKRKSDSHLFEILNEKAKSKTKKPSTGPASPIHSSVRTSLSTTTTVISTGQLQHTFLLKEKLGDGAFGSVWHGQSKIDSQSYAIKLIPFLADEEETNSDQCSLIYDFSQKESFREVRTMAKMESHPNVVRYYTAWMEEMQPFIYEKIKDIDIMRADIDTSTECAMTVPKHYNNILENYDIPRISAAKILNVNISPLSNSEERIWCGELDDNQIFGDESYVFEDDSNTQETKHNLTPTKIPNCVLIIQMELCDNGTLRDWLESRNEVDYIQSLQIFRQIVEALHHIHTYHVLHRDVKPNNVFLCKNGVIKLGDFGLSISPNDKLRLKLNSINSAVEKSDPELTYGLGPEQLKTKDKNSYSKPADIYHLGLILYELLSSFSTGMERVIALNDLKNSGKTNKLMKQKHHRMAHVIEAMISLQPENRPTTYDILDVLNAEFTELQIECPSQLISPTKTSNSVRSSMTGSLCVQTCHDEIAPSLFRKNSLHLLSSPTEILTANNEISQSDKITQLEQKLMTKSLHIDILKLRISKLESEKI